SATERSPGFGKIERRLAPFAGLQFARREPGGLLLLGVNEGDRHAIRSRHKIAKAQVRRLAERSLTAKVQANPRTPIWTRHRLRRLPRVRLCLRDNLEIARPLFALLARVEPRRENRPAWKRPGLPLHCGVVEHNVVDDQLRARVGVELNLINALVF